MASTATTPEQSIVSQRVINTTDFGGEKEGFDDGQPSGDENSGNDWQPQDTLVPLSLGRFVKMCPD